MNTALKEKPNFKLLDEIISRHKGKPAEALRILEEAQEANRHKYLSREALEYVSEKTQIPLSRIYSVATFYAFFNLKPQGEHSITVCRGTACHTKGSKTLLGDLESILGIKGAFDEGQSYFTTEDNKITVRTVACFGQCALAPIVVVDEEIHVHMTAEKLRKMIERIRRGGKKR